MNRLRSALLMGLGAACIGAALFLAQRDPVPQMALASKAQEAPPDRLAVMRGAERIGDPLQRCLAYPVPKEYHWRPEAIAAFCADEFSPTLTRNEFDNAIEDGRASEIDARLDALVEGYFAGDVPEGALMIAYADNFKYSSAGIERSIDRWVRDSPASAHALVARGQHHVATANDARGERLAADTAPEDFARMSVASAAAVRDFDEAIARNPRILPAYQGLILAAKLNGDDDLAQHAFDQALAIDPKNFYVRVAMLQRLEPRWGGSLAAMQRLADEATPYLADNPRLANLRAMSLAYAGLPLYWAKDYAGAMRHFDAGLAEGPVVFYFELAGYASGQLGDNARAAEFASQSLRFAPGYLVALRSRAYHLTELGEFDWAKSDLDILLLANPRDSQALRAKAQVLIRTGDDEAAEAGLRQLIAMNSRDLSAKQSLAWLYGYRLGRARDADALIGEMLEQEPQNGELWLMRVKLLDAHPGPGMREAVESFLRNADESSAEQRKMKPVAEKWLAAHPR